MAMQMQKTVQHGVKLITCNNVRAMSSLLKGNDQSPSSNTPSNKLHVTSRQSYPLAAVLPLPPNIDPTECNRFSPQRSRDIGVQQYSNGQRTIDVTVDNTATNQIGLSDPHVASYDCHNPISTSCVMQSMVPEPFNSNEFTNLNMPGGSWEQTNKFVSHDLQSSHYTNLRQEVRKNWSSYNSGVVMKTGITSHKRQFSTAVVFDRPGLVEHLSNFNWHFVITNSNRYRFGSQNFGKPYSTMTNPNVGDEKKPEDVKPLSRKDQLKKAVKEYGSTVIIFHVGISLMSLGTCYLLVSSGLDVVSILDQLGLSAMSSKAAAGAASTFVISYAIHKVFAPVRISITLFSTPFIVRFLRKKGILKPPKPQ